MVFGVRCSGFLAIAARKSRVDFVVQCAPNSLTDTLKDLSVSANASKADVLGTNLRASLELLL